jgi:vacuolar-type H+-ATPase subunit E/Vma4
VALADIIARIGSDADAEATVLISGAEQRAVAILAEAKSRAESEREAVLSTAEKDAAREASRIVVAARLAARDGAVAERRALIASSLAEAAEAIAHQGSGEYAGFLARRIVAAARGGETLSFGTEDVARADAVMRMLNELSPGLQLTLSDQPAPFARGALVAGPRARVDLSLDAIVSEDADALEAVVAGVLFGEGE